MCNCFSVVLENIPAGLVGALGNFQPTVLLELAELLLVPVAEILGHDLPNPSSLFSVQRVVSAVPMVVHVVRPHVPPDLVILVPQLQLLPLRVLVVNQVYRIVGQPIAISRPLPPQLDFLQVVPHFLLLHLLALLHDFPSFVFPLQLLESLLL